MPGIILLHPTENQASYMKLPRKTLSGRRRSFLALGVLAVLGAGALVSYRQAPAAFKSRVRVLEAQVAALDLGYAPPPLPTKQKTSTVDGMIQIYVPAGEFTMGTSETGFVGSHPVHKVYLGAFWIDRTAVSNAMYASCVAARGCKKYIYQRPGYNTGYANVLYRSYPVTYVSWQEAQAYCSWAGRRLPTEAQWEKAARGTDLLLYPWGSAPPNLSLLNFDSNIGGTVPVDRYPRGASPYGVLQLEGNVREWMQDWFSENYYAASPYNDPKGPASGKTKVLRGASYNDNERGALAFIRFDHVPTSRGANRGFRCVQSAGG